MTVILMVTRRLLRTKQAAAYLSMSEWKLRRLIQTEILPFVQDQRGGPFLVDVCDLDAYIEGNKHNRAPFRSPYGYDLIPLRSQVRWSLAGRNKTYDLEIFRSYAPVHFCKITTP